MKKSLLWILCLGVGLNVAATPICTQLISLFKFASREKEVLAAKLRLQENFQELDFSHFSKFSKIERIAIAELILEKGTEGRSVDLGQLKKLARELDFENVPSPLEMLSLLHVTRLKSSNLSFLRRIVGPNIILRAQDNYEKALLHRGLIEVFKEFRVQLPRDSRLSSLRHLHLDGITPARTVASITVNSLSIYLTSIPFHIPKIRLNDWRKIEDEVLNTIETKGWKATENLVVKEFGKSARTEYAIDMARRVFFLWASTALTAMLFEERQQIWNGIRGFFVTKRQKKELQDRTFDRKERIEHSMNSFLNGFYNDNKRWPDPNNPEEVEYVEQHRKDLESMTDEQLKAKYPKKP